MREIPGWSEKQAIRFEGPEGSVPNPELLYLEDVLKSVHQAVDNDPTEPYCGVSSLFNADLQDPNRDDWVVISPYVIRLVER